MSEWNYRCTCKPWVGIHHVDCGIFRPQPDSQPSTPSTQIKDEGEEQQTVIAGGQPKACQTVDSDVKLTSAAKVTRGTMFQHGFTQNTRYWHRMQGTAEETVWPITGHTSSITDDTVITFHVDGYGRQTCSMTFGDFLEYLDQHDGNAPSKDHTTFPGCGCDHRL